MTQPQTTVSQVLSSGSAPAKRCYHDHPPLKLVDGDETFLIYGGSCSSPAVKDADVYLGLDAGMPERFHQPWKPEGQSINARFKITDMGVPDSEFGFTQMLEWLNAHVRAGRKVHVGCIGGHGRTGFVFAALAAVYFGRKDAITYVRENYCPKAVESDRQVAWLHDKYGVEKAKPTKSYSSTNNGKGGVQSGFGFSRPKGSFTDPLDDSFYGSNVEPLRKTDGPYYGKKRDDLDGLDPAAIKKLQREERDRRRARDKRLGINRKTRTVARDMDPVAPTPGASVWLSPSGGSQAE